ncbi:MAG TPA: hypothetical protein VGO52_19270 [Hyphomonadaceae bacterium]|jgi:hypothetical protein|nr:hypothetical protein [Hyphomonadaceae bacterium]
MADQAVAARSLPGRAMAAARFLVADRLGLIFLIWLAIAFGARGALMDAHAGAPGGLSDWLHARLQPGQLARLAGAMQWASLAGLVLLVSLVHVRLSARGMLEGFRARFGMAAAYGVALTGGYVVFVWTPVTAVSMMLHDAFIFFDAIYRIDAGERPSVDFPTALGAATLYLPWLGSKIAGGFAGAIEMASAIVSLGLCLVCAQACAKRYPTAVSAVLVSAVFLITVPAMLEGYIAPESVTFEDATLLNLEDQYALAMFYNRWGWGALIAVFAFLTPRAQDEKTPVAEVVSLGLMLVFLFWLKLSYFVVAGAAAVLYAFLGAKPWRTIGTGAGVAVGGVALVGLLTGNLFGYVGDILTVAKVSGTRVGDLLTLFRNNLTDFLLPCAPMLVLGFMRKLKPQDIWVTALLVLGTLFTINQNAQDSGVPSMLVAAAYGVWRVREENNKVLTIVAAIALALPAATFVLSRSSGLLGQTMVARREEARPPPSWAGIPALKGVYAQERESLLDQLAESETLPDRMAAFRAMAIYGRRQMLRSAEYMSTMLAAVDELKQAMGKGESVVVMDFASPLSFMTGTRPAKGYWITFDDGRTISETVAPEGKTLFADADHVMMPRIFVEADTATVLKSLYSAYLDGAYETRVETAYWVRWSHRKEVVKLTSLAQLPNTLSTGE